MTTLLQRPVQTNLVQVTLENVTPYPSKFGNGHRKLEIGSRSHIAGIQNTEVDLDSGKNEVHTEWKLKENISSSICSQLNTNPKIDVFATSLNTQLTTFVSCRLDPKCITANAFLLNWSKLDFYAFPSLICLNRVLQKIYQDKAKGIVIAPDWPS